MELINPPPGAAPPPISFVLLGPLPFVVISLCALSNPYWSWRRAKRTLYVLTNERALVFDAGWWQAVTIRSFEPARLADLRRIQNSDGSGDLVFERTVTTDSEGSTKTTDHGFLSIPNVKSVEEAVQRLAGPTDSANDDQARDRRDGHRRYLVRRMFGRRDFPTLRIAPIRRLGIGIDCVGRRFHLNERRYRTWPWNAALVEPLLVMAEGQTNLLRPY
jgi:hypothetical protein